MANVEKKEAQVAQDVTEMAVLNGSQTPAVQQNEEAKKPGIIRRTYEKTKALGKKIFGNYYVKKATKVVGVALVGAAGGVGAALAIDALKNKTDDADQDDAIEVETNISEVPVDEMDKDFGSDYIEEEQA